jgi:hypothetical protein
MVAPISIPNRYEPALVSISKLDEKALGELAEALNEAPKTIDVASLSNTLAERVESASDSEIAEIVPALLFFHSYREYTGTSAAQAAESIASAIYDELTARLEDISLERSVFTKRMSRLLASQPLLVSARAAQVLSDHEKVWIDGRVLTDVRPIFERENPNELLGVSIVHTLKVNYHTGDEHKEIFVAMDAKDVSSLVDKLTRANAKADTLKRIFGEQSDITYIDVE